MREIGRNREWFWEDFGKVLAHGFFGMKWIWWSLNYYKYTWGSIIYSEFRKYFRFIMIISFFYNKIYLKMIISELIIQFFIENKFR